MTSPKGYIWFYGASNRGIYKNYRQFSNFYPAPFILNGITYQTVEHYYQSKKFINTLYEYEVANALTPQIAKRMGRSKKYPLRADWEDVKIDIMLEGIRGKLNYHRDIEELLINTGDLIICEHTKNDNYWADGGDLLWTPDSKIGKNQLGRALMKIRNELR